MITASVNVGPLLAKLQKLGVVTKRPMQELVKEQARLFVSSSGNVPGMVQATPPNSAGVKGSAAKKQGEHKVRRDIRRVYGLPSDAYALIKAKDPRLAGVFWGLVLSREWQKASEFSRRLTGYALQDFDGGAAHERRRTNGVVNDKRHGMFIREPVGRSGELAKYIKRKQKNVGILASGFNDSAERLGAKGVPEWIKRHKGKFSGYRIQETPTSFFVVMSDKVPFGQSDTVRRMSYVLRYRSAALSRSMPYIIRKAIKDAGFTTAGVALT
jgi:hypothetical protein